MTDRDHSPAVGHSGPTVRDEVADRRSRRSRRLLHEALIALLREKPYRKITVQNIVDRADVGRSTFYDHFRDKDELFATGVGEMIASLVQPIDGSLPIQSLFEHVAERHDLYRAIRRARLVDRMFHVGQLALAESIAATLGEPVISGEPPLTDAQGLIPPPVPLAIRASFLAGAVLNLLRWWLDQEMPYPPVEMDRMFQRLLRR